jgi:hypothetical protein
LGDSVRGAILIRSGDDSNREPGAWAVVWISWTVITAAMFVLVASYGPNLPRWDDFDVVEVMARGRCLSVEWLWSFHNEHRVPLPRLILLFLYQQSGNDFRAGMFFSVAMLSLLAGAALAVAAWRRGGSRTYDLLIPLILLNPSNAVNFFWSWQLQLVLSTAIAGVLILLIVARAAWPSLPVAIAGGICLLALPLCGANGVAHVPAFACWLIAAFLAHWISGDRERRLRAVVVVATTVPGIILTILYFSGLRAAVHHSSAAGLDRALRTSAQFASLMFGTEAHDLWPASGLAALALVTISASLLIRTLAIGPACERPRALGLLCAFGALMSLILGIGWGRAGAGELAGFEARYVTLVSPIWLALIFTWDIYTPPAARRVVLTLLLAVMLVLLWPTAREAIASGKSLASQAHSFTHDVRSGEPIYRLAKRHAPFLHPSQDVLADELVLLKKARIGVFSSMQDNPSFHEISVPLPPADVRLLRWENGTAYVTGVDPFLHYILPRAKSVCGIRLRYSHTNDAHGPARFRIWWASGATLPSAPGQSYSNWALPTGNGRVTMIWVDDVMKEFWLQPDNQPCQFTPTEIALLCQ